MKIQVRAERVDDPRGCTRPFRHHPPTRTSSLAEVQPFRALACVRAESEAEADSPIRIPPPGHPGETGDDDWDSRTLSRVGSVSGERGHARFGPEASHGRRKRTADTTEERRISSVVSPDRAEPPV